MKFSRGPIFVDKLLSPKLNPQNKYDSTGMIVCIWQKWNHEKFVKTGNWTP